MKVFVLHKLDHRTYIKTLGVHSGFVCAIAVSAEDAGEIAEKSKEWGPGEYEFDKRYRIVEFELDRAASV